MAEEYEVNAAAFRQMLLDQRATRMKGGLYHVTQIHMAYNTNRIEGSTLTEDQTRFLYDTRAIDGELVLVDDVIETMNSFRMFNLMLDSLNQPLTLSRIREYHYILKTGTKDGDNPNFTVGGWKKLANTVGGITTSAPQHVPADMQQLFADTPEHMSFEDICDFHWRFETIHPFQDGNGRVGRLIMFEQCLRNDIMPFVVLEQQKQFYYRGLNRYEEHPGFLRETFRNFQDAYYEKHAQYVAPHRVQVDDSARRAARP
ncbi:MAG: Fic family protein [Promicromonosporaceae bacterium]|nr:Fic family protein [Promicromonosporaceae bacterium]